MPVERSGKWAVREGDAAGTLSEHVSQTDAVRAARERARARGAERVYIRDRYFRIRAERVRD